MIISHLPLSLPYGRPRASAPPDRCESVPSDEAIELMRQVRKAGYRFSLGGMPFDPPRVDTQRPPVGVTLERATRMPAEQVRISRWNQLRELAALAGGGEVARPELARTLLALERAGAQLCILGAADPPQATTLQGIFPEPRPEGPRAVGALGAYLQPAETPVFLVPPDARFPTRLDSLETARYFVLHEGEPPAPQAARLRDLGAQGYGFRVGDRSIGALGAHLATEPVELTLGGHPVAPLGDPRLQIALDYHRDHPDADAGTLRALALPGDLPLAERLELHQNLLQALDRPRQGEYTPLRGTSMAGVDPRVQDAACSARAARVLADLWSGGPDNVRLGTSLLENSRLRTAWTLEAAPHLLRHPQDRPRLEALGAIGGTSLADTLKADAMLTTPGEREAFLALAKQAAVDNLLLEGRGDPMVQALQAFEHLQSHRWSQLPLAEDAARLGDLIKPLGLEAALRVRPHLQPATLDLFLREHKLARDVDTALACLQPGGNPALPETLEQREQAERLVAQPSLLLGEEKDRAYDFLLTLPNRQLVPDARLLCDLRSALPEGDARSLLRDFKAGELDARTPEELTVNLALEKKLWGTDARALTSLRNGLPDAETRQRLLSGLQAGLGEVVWEDWTALQTPLPQGVTPDQGLSALIRLRGALEPKAARQAYTALLQSGRALEDGVDDLLRASLTGNALRGLDTAPTSGVVVDRAGVTVGGVRLRTRA